MLDPWQHKVPQKWQGASLEVSSIIGTKDQHILMLLHWVSHPNLKRITKKNKKKEKEGENEEKQQRKKNKEKEEGEEEEDAK